MLTSEEHDGDTRFFWRGERIGSFAERGMGFVSGCAIYRGAVLDTDDYSEDGIPLRWIPEKLEAMCARVDARRAAA